MNLVKLMGLPFAGAGLYLLWHQRKHLEKDGQLLGLVSFVLICFGTSYGIWTVGVEDTIRQTSVLLMMALIFVFWPLRRSEDVRQKTTTRTRSR